MSVQLFRLASAVLLLVAVASCASVGPEPPVATPQAAVAQPAALPPAVAQPAAPPPAVAPTPPVAARPAAVAPAAVASAPKAPPVAGGVVAPAASAPVPAARTPAPATPSVAARPSPAVPATLDLKSLTERLRATKAIGVFTKLSLKNKVDDLLKQFRGHYDGKAVPTMSELRQSYNLLMMKVLTLLQDDDQQLASAIVASREAIWDLLANRDSFAALQA
jgi:hypothetical protein